MVINGVMEWLHHHYSGQLLSLKWGSLSIVALVTLMNDTLELGAISSICLVGLLFVAELPGVSTRPPFESGETNMLALVIEPLSGLSFLYHHCADS